jgi:hypothetical protein
MCSQQFSQQFSQHLNYKERVFVLEKLSPHRVFRLRARPRGSKQSIAARGITL